ncbi:MAG: hypothetical protein ACTHW1_01925 [Ancrocorticia sp.]|uniref:hypothetical protein n=1 Tax=Ancrocorticia sp. TaxID=2593684 RepID=UPI003F926332
MSTSEDLPTGESPAPADSQEALEALDTVREHQKLDIACGIVIGLTFAPLIILWILGAAHSAQQVLLGIGGVELAIYLPLVAFYLDGTWQTWKKALAVIGALIFLFVAIQSFLGNWQ